MAHVDPRVLAAVGRVFKPAATIAMPMADVDLSDVFVPHELPRVTVLRPADLLRIEFRFVNLRRVDADGTDADGTDADGVSVLTRRRANAPAFLIAGFGPQHVLEQAFFDPAGPLTQAPPPTPEPGGAETPIYPVQARISRASRIAYLVTTERIVYSEAGLLHAMRVLPLSVVPHAEGSPFIGGWWDLATDAGAIDTVSTRVRSLRTGAARRVGRRRAGDAAALVALPPAKRSAELDRIDATGIQLTELAEAARLQRTAAELEARFGPSAAVAAVAIDLRPGVEILPLLPLLPIDRRPPIPREPASTETALELPWRLQLSPHARGAFAHALDEVEHDGRVELWHSRLASRTDAPADLDPATTPPLDENQPASRTVRAVWTRDFTAGNGPAEQTQQKLVGPDEDFGDQVAAAMAGKALLPFRATLSVRDRMQLVHLTSNHRWPGNRPSPAAVDNLMLTAAGGWLASEAHFDPTNAQGLSIEEWKHRATMGRDHYVKVVYQGVLLPWGHRAALVKITERRVKEDGHATLYQRLFVVVRQPERRYLASGAAMFDNRLPFRWVRILTASTPPLAAPNNLAAGGGQAFVPEIATSDGPAGPNSSPGQKPFMFRMLANDVGNRLIEFEGPLVFVEKTVFEASAFREGARVAANNATPAYDLRGQRIVYAAPLDPDDTTLATASIEFDAEFDTVTTEKGVNFVLPVMKVARAAVPAMSAFTGQSGPVDLTYATAYRAKAFGTGPTHAGNETGLFLELASPDGAPATTPSTMGFSSQSDRSGGFVSPSVDVKALARRIGPVGGDLTKLAQNAASFDVGGMFGLDTAKLFGILPLADLLPAQGGPLPKFITRAVNTVVGLAETVQEARAFVTQHASALASQPAAVKQAAADLALAAQEFADAVALFAPAPHPPQDFAGIIGRIGTRANTLQQAFAPGAPPLPLARPVLERTEALLGRLSAIAADATTIAGLVQQFYTGALLPEKVSARLDWETRLEPWSPPGLTPGPGTAHVFTPEGDKMLRLTSEVQAPLSSGQPTALVSCSLPPFTLQLLGSTEFIAIHVSVMEFSVRPGRKPDVNVALREAKGIEFLGPLAFVETLKEIIPFDGFSDPPYLDIAASGLKAGFDLAIPDLAVGVFSLSNIHFGAELSVPFIGESLEFRFFFATRENPFRLAVALFAGGGFFAITISPEGLRVIEASFEFGAAIEMSFAVASGSLSVMAGIYFRLEVDGDAQSVQLTGYFRARGEVDVLGLISACIELYLELSYRSISGPEGDSAKAVGKASISIEVSVCFASFSVSVSCEKQFAGSSGDPTFVQIMGPYTDAVGAARDPWAEYCGAFALETI